MGLTRPRAHQLQDIDYKQTSRAITTTNITLSGGAPATVDGVSLALNDRVLVTGQSTGSENGIYSVTTVGAGSNGTWARSSDADGAGELNAGSITMVTEGTTYADTQWKLTTDDPITIGSTALTFVRNGAAAYGVFAVEGQSSIVADAVGDTLTIVAGTNIALTTNDGTDTLTITPSLTPAFTSLTAAGLAYPTADGTSGQAIITDASGNLSFGDVSGGGTGRVTFNYAITGTPTTVTGADSNGDTLAYTAGQLDVFVNGVRMAPADITATNGTSVVFGSALANSDVVDIVTYTAFDVVTNNADDLSSGTVPDARFPATLPAISGANLTNLDATDLTGTIASARVAGAYTGITSTGTLTGFTSTGIDDNADATAITIDSAEKVGIGISNPSSYDDGGDKLVVGDTSGRSGITIVSSTSNDGSINFADGTSGTASYMGFINYHHNTNTMKLATNAGTRLTIDSNGNVGIGVTGGAIKLDVLTTVSDNFVAKFENSHATGSYGISVKAGDDSGNYTADFANKSGTSLMRIRGDGNVGIGTSSNLQGSLTVFNGDDFSTATNNSSDNIYLISDATSGDGVYGASISFSRVQYPDRKGAAIVAVQNGSDEDNVGLAFFTHPSATATDPLVEAMRIDSSGSALFGGLTDSTPYGAGAPGFIVSLNNGSQYGMIGGCDNIANREAILFVNPNGAVGSIKTNGSSTTFNTSSDYRLKENVNYSFDATTRLKQLKPARFNFIVDADTTVDGFLAHEVSSIVPEAIGGEKDGVKVWQDGEELPDGISIGDNKLDSDGNTIPYYQSIDQSKLVPLLVKTIQELEARITALEGA